MVEGIIIGETPVGGVTVRILEMNHPQQIEMRRYLLEAGFWD